MSSSLDSRVRHKRTVGALFRAIGRTENFRSVGRTIAMCPAPFDFLYRYLKNGGDYPAVITVRTPTGPIKMTTYCSDDIQTINEIFFRGDYEAGVGNEVIVDFGSNIGLSAAYFLSRNPKAFVYCYEPLPQNVERLKTNLAPFEGRYEIFEKAVGESNGTVQFGWEPTGRYGGVGRDTGHWITVDCLDSNDVLDSVIARHGRIDLLKIDVETLEKAVTERIPQELARKINNLVVEYPFKENPLANTHRMVKRNVVTAFVNSDYDRP